MKHPNIPFLAFIGVCFALASVSAFSQGKSKGCMDCKVADECTVIKAEAPDQD